MEPDRNVLLPLLIGGDYFESYYRYQPSREDFYYGLVDRLGPTWSVQRLTPYWYTCRSTGQSLNGQGWKIHLSTVPNEATALLTAVTPILKHYLTPFKVALDRYTTFLLVSRNWPRTAGGKFLTIYPRNDETFAELIEEIHRVTIDFKGQYVLSDIRYKDSSVVHYRYGAFVATGTRAADGELVYEVRTPTGESVMDRRSPYFAPPAWARDPIMTGATEYDDLAPVGGILLNDGRYHVHSALAVKNAGGVYAATDTLTGEPVIIKEARPNVLLSPDGVDAVAGLREEHRILQALAGDRIAPRPTALFAEWEHLFLVEEQLTGITLNRFVAANNPLLQTDATVEDKRVWLRMVCEIGRQLAVALQKVHAHDIVVGDLSPTNVMVDETTLTVWLIDFDGAHQMGVRPLVPLGTPGFSRVFDRRSDPSTAIDGDLFGLGALLFALLFPLNHLVALDSAAAKRILRAFGEDLGVSQMLQEAILYLLEDSGKEPRTLQRVEEWLCDEACSAWVPLAMAPLGVPTRSDGDAAARAERMLAYIENSADPSRSDRLFPADYSVFWTNPLSVAYGACGVAYAFNRVRGEVPVATLSWIAERLKEPNQMPPGLLVGSSGVAWSLAEVGDLDRAESVLRLAGGQDSCRDSMNLFFGRAGWGLTRLYFFLKTGRQCYLDEAVAAWHILASRAIRDPNSASTHWPSEDIQLGMGYGASGVALFCLYLYCLIGDRRILQLGIDSLAFDIGHASDNRGGLTWPRYADRKYVTYPYLSFGTAGIAAVVLRYLVVTGDDSYRRLWELCGADLERKYAAFCGVSCGLAGIGHVWLDAYSLLRQVSYLGQATNVAAGIQAFEIARPAGTAVPGEGARISCDYATGVAGVAVFLDRLAKPHREAPFFLDSILPRDSVQAVRGVTPMPGANT